MADRYLKATGLWADNNTWSATDGGAAGASYPVAGDNVFFTANGNGLTVTLGANAACATITGTGSSTATIAGAYKITVTGDVTFLSTMTLTGFQVELSGSGTINFTTGGKTLPAWLRGTGFTGTLNFLDNCNATNDISLQTSAKTVVTNNYTISATTINLAGTFTPGSSVINASSNCDWSGITSMTANTAVLNITGTGNWTGGSVDFNGLSINLNGTAHTVSGAFTCNVLTRNGTATKTDSITFTSGTTVTCTTFAMIGNSATNRLLVQSSTLGSPATITATNWTGSQNVDIMDITDTNAVDLSAITGNSGDCGGNTGITFTPAVAQTWDGTTGNWSNSAKWTSRVPLPQDDVTISAGTVTADMPRWCKDFNQTGSTIAKNNQGAGSIYGSMAISGTSAWSASQWSDYTYFRGRGTHTISTNTAMRGETAFYAPGGTYTYNSDYTCSTAKLTVFRGTVNFGAYTYTHWLFSISGTGVRTVNLGAGTFVPTATSPTSIWVASDTTNLTFNAGTSTISYTQSTTSSQIFAGGGLTYNNLTIQGSGNYITTITGSNTFNNVTINASQAAKTVKFTDGTTTHVTNLLRDTNGTNVITLTGTSTAGWNIVKDGVGNVNLDYVNVSYSQAS